MAAIGCGPVAYGGPAPTAEECEAVSGGEQGTPDELSELMAELIAPRICAQATGSFIGLPGEESHEGPDAGLDPAVGRWWIRRCRAEVIDGRLNVAIGGPGWTWLDRESTGFRVRQYLRFEGEATFSASLHVGYDRRQRVASIRLRPAPGVRAQVEPTGLVQAEATSIFSSLLGGVLDMAGSSASDQARQQASEEGSSRLTERLATGFTVTYSLDSEQMDFMLGELSRGQTPRRPWPSQTGAWLVNERSGVWPGGMDVVGPIAADAGDVTLDVELEAGDGAVVRRVCEETLHQWLDAAWSGRQRGAPDGDRIAELAATRSPQTFTLPNQECRSLLLVTPRAGGTVPAVLRYRVTPLEPPSSGTTVVATGGTATSGQAGSAAAAAHPTPAPAPRTWRIQVRSVTVAAHDASGSAWDMFGGEPDPYVVVSSIADGRELHRTRARDDTREVQIDSWIPTSVRADQFPVRFVVYDEDVAGDQVVGSVDLEAGAVPNHATDIALDLRSQGGDTPARTGVIRVHLEPSR